jgi:hypothetical protein
VIVLRFLGALAVFLVPAGVASLAMFTLAQRSRDEWKVLAWVPVVPLFVWAVYIAWGLTRDPTSHNLWPFELVFWGALSLVLLGLFLLGRRLFGGPRDDWSARRERDRSRR